MTAEINPEKRRTILFTHKDIGDTDKGGLCVLFKSLARGLSGRNWSVHVVTTQDFNMEGVESHKIDNVEDPREYAKAVTQVVETVRPDIAESSTWRAELLDYSVNTQRSSKVVVRADPSAGTLFDDVEDLMEGEGVLCTNADLILAVSQFAKEDIEKRYRVTGVHVVYNGIPDNKDLAHTTTLTSGEILNPFNNETTKIGEVPITDIVKPEKVNVIWIGKPTRMKGFDFLEKIVEYAPDSINFIINTGYSPSEVRWKAENYQKCTFIRALTKQEQLSILRLSSVFISTSRVEGLGIAVAEALQEGLPVMLNADCKVFYEFLPNEAVVLVNMQDTTSVIDMLIGCSDKKVPYSRNPLRFTQKQMIDDSIIYYNSLLNPRS